MPDLTAQFKQAQADAKGLAARPDDATLLKLYSLFKQATVGDAGGDRPGVWDFVQRAKYDAWEQMRGMEPNEAMRQYVALVKSLQS